MIAHPHALQGMKLYYPNPGKGASDSTETSDGPLMQASQTMYSKPVVTQMDLASLRMQGGAFIIDCLN